MILSRTLQAPAGLGSAPARNNLARVALDLFERNGYEATTVDAIAEAARVNRRTFFRYFEVKEDVAFAEQKEAMQRFAAGLELSSGEPVAVASRVLEALLGEATRDLNLLRRRAEVIRKSPALGDRESVWWGAYQHLLGDYLGATVTSSRDQMFANVIAAALLAAYRQVLASVVLAGANEDARALFVELADDITESMSGSGPRGSGLAPHHPERREVIVISTNLTAPQIAELLEQRGS